MPIQTIQWRAGKRILCGGRSSQSRLAQVKLPNPGVVLSIVEEIKGWCLEPETLLPALPLMPAYSGADDPWLLQLVCLLCVSIEMVQC